MRLNLMKTIIHRHGIHNTYIQFFPCGPVYQFMHILQSPLIILNIVQTENAQLK